MPKYYVTRTFSVLFSYVVMRHRKLFYARPSYQSSRRQYDLYHFMYILTLTQNSYVQHTLHLTYTLFRELKAITVRDIVLFLKVVVNSFSTRTVWQSIATTDSQAICVCDLPFTLIK